MASGTPKVAARNSKTSLVVSMFDRGNLGPREIAEKTGFEGHRELANYMGKRGYAWDSDAQNYVSQEPDAQAEDPEKEGETKEEPPAERAEPEESGDVLELLAYLPFLRRLAGKEKELDALLDPGGLGTVPRYAIGGERITKSIYMSKKVAELTKEFSELSGISQRDIVEAALIEYFRRHGFGEQADSVLAKR